jgi:hypothetical protein
MKASAFAQASTARVGGALELREARVLQNGRVA